MSRAWLSGQLITADRLNDNHAVTLDYTSITADTATSGTTTALVAITTPTITFRTGRAFSVTYGGRMNLSADQVQGVVSVRKTTSTTDPILLDSARIAVSGTAGSIGFTSTNIFTNTSGADTSVVLLGLYFWIAGIALSTVRIVASTQQPAYLWTQDIGPSSDYPNAAAMF